MYREICQKTHLVSLHSDSFDIVNFNPHYYIEKGNRKSQVPSGSQSRRLFLMGGAKGMTIPIKNLLCFFFVLFLKSCLGPVQRCSLFRSRQKPTGTIRERMGLFFCLNWKHFLQCFSFFIVKYINILKCDKPCHFFFFCLYNFLHIATML